MLVPFDPNQHTPQDVGLGGDSTEVTITVDMPDGRVALIPSVWWDDKGNPVLIEDQRVAVGLAERYEGMSNKLFPRFGMSGQKANYEAAGRYAMTRSKLGGASHSPLAKEPNKEKSSMYFDVPKQLMRGMQAQNVGQRLQTEADFSPEVLDTIRYAVGNALAEGREGTSYEDFPSLPDGTPMKDFVSSSQARGGAFNVLKLAATNPNVAAALSLGRGSIKVDDNDNVFFTDRYDFSPSKLGTDLYSLGRKALSYLIPEGEGNPIELYLGKKKDIVPEIVDLSNNSFESSVK